MFCGARGVVFGLKIEAQSSLETFEAQVWKKSLKLHQMCRPRPLFDVTFGVCWACLATLSSVWASLLKLAVVFFRFSLKSAYTDSMPLSSGSAVFARPSVQVGAAGDQKSCRTAALATFGRLGDGRVRSALSELWKPALTAGTQPRLGSRRRAKSI